MRAGIRPALISDDLPHPDGPTTQITRSARSRCRCFCVLVSRPRKAACSCWPKARRPGTKAMGVASAPVVVVLLPPPASRRHLRPPASSKRAGVGACRGGAAADPRRRRGAAEHWPGARLASERLAQEGDEFLGAVREVRGRRDDNDPVGRLDLALQPRDHGLPGLDVLLRSERHAGRSESRPQRVLHPPLVRPTVRNELSGRDSRAYRRLPLAHPTRTRAPSVTTLGNLYFTTAVSDVERLRLDVGPVLVPGRPKVQATASRAVLVVGGTRRK